MAKEKENNLIKMPAETAARLRELEADLAKSEKALSVLRDLGIDVHVLEDKLKWSQNVRKTLLEQFG